MTKIFYPQIFNINSLTNGYNRTKNNTFYNSKLPKTNKLAIKLKMLSKKLKTQTYKPKKKIIIFSKEKNRTKYLRITSITDKIVENTLLNLLEQSTKTYLYNDYKLDFEIKYYETLYNIKEH